MSATGAGGVCGWVGGITEWGTGSAATVEGVSERDWAGLGVTRGVSGVEGARGIMAEAQ